MVANRQIISSFKISNIIRRYWESVQGQKLGLLRESYKAPSLYEGYYCIDLRAPHKTVVVKHYFLQGRSCSFQQDNAKPQSACVVFAAQPCLLLNNMQCRETGLLSNRGCTWSKSRSDFQNNNNLGPRFRNCFLSLVKTVLKNPFPTCCHAVWYQSTIETLLYVLHFVSAILFSSPPPLSTRLPAVVCLCAFLWMCACLFRYSQTKCICHRSTCMKLGFSQFYAQVDFFPVKKKSTYRHSHEFHELDFLIQDMSIN